MSDSIAPTASGPEVSCFIANSGLSKVDLELRLGFTKASKGKNLRRWELYGAPSMASILMAYMHRYGLDLANELLAGDGSVPLSAEEGA